jgi:predicted glutamine amidotransferase
MCIAILNAKGVLSLKTFKTCWAANPDGAGLCYFDGERIQTAKEMKSVKNFHKIYLSVREKYPEIDIAIHFRISTHGRVNITNCHPFKVNKTTAFIHNGVINNMGVNPDFSDTYIFNETIMKSLPANFVKNTAVLELLSNYIGYSKLVIISGEISSIVNEELGFWDANNWYSNKSYIAPKEAKLPAAARYGWDYWDGWEYDAKSKGYVNSKADKLSIDIEEIERGCKICECCRESAESVSYVNSWSMNVCDKCIEEFRSDEVTF